MTLYAWMRGKCAGSALDDSIQSKHVSSMEWGTLFQALVEAFKACLDLLLESEHTVGPIEDKTLT